MGSRALFSSALISGLASITLYICCPGPVAEGVHIIMEGEHHDDQSEGVHIIMEGEHHDDQSEGVHVIMEGKHHDDQSECSMTV